MIRDINHHYLLAIRHLYSIFERYAITRGVWPSSMRPLSFFQQYCSQ